MWAMKGQPTIITVTHPDGTKVRRLFITQGASDLYMAGVREAGGTHYGVEAAEGDGWLIDNEGRVMDE